MARFYFHIKEGDCLVEDHEGIELSDLVEARAEAIEAAREIFADAIRSGREFVDKAFVIVDEQGRHLMSIPMRDALPKGFKG